MRLLQVLSFIGAIAALAMGFYKMFVYENPEGYFGGIKNAYVGSDAANFTINSGYATAFFVLFGSLLLAGILIEVIIQIKPKTEEVTPVEESDLIKEMTDQ